MKASPSSSKTMEYARTPFRVQTPRMSPSPAYFSSRSTRRNRRAATNLCPPSNDRFIPNRARKDPLQGCASLRKKRTDQDNVRKTAQQEYERQLRKALFGGDNLEPRILFFGIGDSSSRSPRIEDTFQHDTLRPYVSTPCESNPALQRVPNTSSHSFVLQAPGVLHDDNLNLVSVGSPLLALALYDTIWFQGPGGTVGMLERESPQVITAVQWSKGGKYLAVGGKEEVQIWSQSSGEMVSFRNHSGYVTAIDWKDENEFVAASQGEMHRYNLRSSQPHKTSYDCGSEPIFSLQWNSEYIASAAGNDVCLWNPRQDGWIQESLCKLHHDGVNSVEFCLLQANVLASGGADGIKIWNVRSGQLKFFIPTKVPVTSLVWSPYRREIMAGYGETMGIWTVTTEVTQLAEWSFHELDGHVLTLQRAPNSGTVVSLHRGELLIGWNAFGEAPKRQRNNFLDDMRCL
jgi:WD40 repeat protein